MKKLPFLSIVSVCLLLLNIALLYYVFQHEQGIKLPLHRFNGPKELIIEKLNFSPTQVKEYEFLIQAHRRDVRNTEQSIFNLKNELYLSLNDSISSEKKDSIIDAIAAKHKDLENIHLKHFDAIKDLCNKDQMGDFENLVNELATMFRPPHPPIQSKRPE